MAVADLPQLVAEIRRRVQRDEPLGVTVRVQVKLSYRHHCVLCGRAVTTRWRVENNRVVCFRCKPTKKE